ncbi:hypothetical protein AVEN_161460-1 [Araneus ventricosus]|uniref:Uncharacterized protein n=1 Tax=Araneus ventricosus TaxID=182803 RepID=A0A4Y2II99_ARAVE|nr:hypothetical protein AVEN_161460-1 [Araneus ventricosus]
MAVTWTPTSGRHFIEKSLALFAQRRRNVLGRCKINPREHKTNANLRLGRLVASATGNLLAKQMAHCLSFASLQVDRFLGIRKFSRALPKLIFTRGRWIICSLDMNKNRDSTTK